MDADRQMWHIWAQRLHRWGVQGLAATLLESFGPLTVLGAQAVFLCQPLLNQMFPEDQLDALANVLEDSVETRRFVEFLREAAPN